MQRPLQSGESLENARRRAFGAYIRRASVVPVPPGRCRHAVPPMPLTSGFDRLHVRQRAPTRTQTIGCVIHDVDARGHPISRSDRPAMQRHHDDRASPATAGSGALILGGAAAQPRP